MTATQRGQAIEPQRWSGPGGWEAPEEYGPSRAALTQEKVGYAGLFGVRSEELSADLGEPGRES